MKCEAKVAPNMKHYETLNVMKNDEDEDDHDDDDD